MIQVVGGRQLNSEKIIDHTMLIIKQPAFSIISSAVFEETDSEACGFLLGQYTKSSVICETARQARNIYSSRSSFAISPTEYAELVRQVGPNGRLVGLYHSHFGSAHLSFVDKSNMSLHGLVWLVIGRRKDKIGQDCQDWRCFRWIEGGIRRLSIQMVDRTDVEFKD